jgi:hypothetical protein
MSQQDVWDAEDREMRRAFAEKDAEIERLKAELAFQTDMAAQADMFVQQYSRLIGELADALSHYALLNDFEKSLLQRAKDAIK